VVEKFDEEVILDQISEWLSIERIHNNRRAITGVITFEPRWEDEAENEFYSILKITIQRIINKDIDVPNSKILFIINAFI